MAEDWRRLIEELARQVAARRVTQEEIAQHSGVDQSQVSRILAGSAKRESQNVQRLCRYARSIRTAPGATDLGRRQIDNAVDKLWDGSAAHARAIAKALDSMAAVQRAFAGRIKK
ncbi:MAG TPA: hypothetical protein PLE54_04855 [Burkholderiaceae bacterium]|nr:hypothetical protein [Burkholderiaceae bacterium]